MQYYMYTKTFTLYTDTFLPTFSSSGSHRSQKRTNEHILKKKKYNNIKLLK